MIELALATILHVTDISGRGYENVVFETTNRIKAEEQSRSGCKVFKEKGEDYFRVICIAANIKKEMKGL